MFLTNEAKIILCKLELIEKKLERLENKINNESLSDYEIISLNKLSKLLHKNSQTIIKEYILTGLLPYSLDIKGRYIFSKKDISDFLDKLKQNINTLEIFDTDSEELFKNIREKIIGE